MSKDNNIVEEEGAPVEVPAEQKDSFRSFVSTLAQFSGDLSNLTCPSFLLSSVSLLEYRQVSSSFHLLSCLMALLCCRLPPLCPHLLDIADD